MKKSVLYLVICCLSVICTVSAHADDAAWVVDVTEVAGADIVGMCEDNNILYFLKDTGIGGNKTLCALSLETHEIKWSYEFSSFDTFFRPVIDENGMVHFFVENKHEVYTITPQGSIVDTTYLYQNSPLDKRLISENGTIRWRGAENGYKSGAPAIGYGGMTIGYDTATGEYEDYVGLLAVNLAAFDIYDNVQWHTKHFSEGYFSGSYNTTICYSVIDKDGNFYVPLANNDFAAYSAKGDLLWLLHDLPVTASPVIGSDGSLYIGSGAKVYRIATVSDGGSVIPGDIVDIYEGDVSGNDTMIIVQDSLLCWADASSIEAFRIPSDGYQEGAYWPCFGHDNRMSFSTTAPVLHDVTGNILRDGAPLGGVIVEVVGTDQISTTGSAGNFLFRLPSGGYTIRLQDSSNVQTFIVADDPVSGIVLDDSPEYIFAWSSALTNDTDTRLLSGYHQAIDHFGNIIVGCEYSGYPGMLYSIAQDGSRNWDIEDIILVADYAPVIGNDMIYIGALGEDGSVPYHFNVFGTNGQLQWFLPLSILNLPAVGSDNTVYVHTPEIGITGYNQSGKLVWQSEIAVPGGQPVIDQNGVVYVTYGVNLTAFNADGSVKWTYVAPESLNEAVLGADAVIIRGGSSTMYAVDYNGEYKTKYTPDGRIFRSPSIDADGTLYIGALDYNLYAFHSDGTVKWKTPVTDMIKQQPVIAADNMIYACGDSTIYAFKPDGSIRWLFRIPNETGSHANWQGGYLALDDNGMLYCTHHRLKSLYAFQTDSPGLKTTAPWPCYRANNQRTGRISNDVIPNVEITDTPVSFDLLANYPNPFNPTTTISFTLPENGMVRLDVYSISGQKVATLVDDTLDAGSHSVVFDGAGLASGLYIYRLEAEGNMQTGKMLLMK